MQLPQQRGGPTCAACSSRCHSSAGCSTCSLSCAASSRGRAAARCRARGGSSSGSTALGRPGWLPGRPGLAEPPSPAAAVLGAGRCWGGSRASGRGTSATKCPVAAARPAAGRWLGLGAVGCWRRGEASRRAHRPGGQPVAGRGRLQCAPLTQQRGLRVLHGGPVRRQVLRVLGGARQQLLQIQEAGGVEVAATRAQALLDLQGERGGEVGEAVRGARGREALGATFSTTAFMSADGGGARRLQRASGRARRLARDRGDSSNHRHRGGHAASRLPCSAVGEPCFERARGRHRCGGWKSCASIRELIAGRASCVLGGSLAAARAGTRAGAGRTPNRRRCSAHQCQCYVSIATRQPAPRRDQGARPPRRSTPRMPSRSRAAAGFPT
jgi:hypothetical protein